MIEVGLIGVAVLLGVDWRRLVLVVAAVLAPVLVGALLIGLILRNRRRGDDGAAMFCESVASELRSGASLRQALTSAEIAVGAIPSVPSPTATDTLDAMATRIRQAFPEVGPELEMTVKTAARSGSRVADLFDEIGSVAIAETEIGHEVRVATAPARATALLFLAAPTLYLVMQARSGGLGQVLAVTEQRVVGIAGLLLFLSGLAVALLIVWRAR